MALDILSGDVSNAYLNAKPLETCHVEVKDRYIFGTSAGPASIFCDREPAAKSAVNPEAPHEKKNLSIAYHKCRECFTAGVVDIHIIYSENNLVNLLTKVLPVVKRKEIFDCIYV